MMLKSSMNFSTPLILSSQKEPKKPEVPHAAVTIAESSLGRDESTYSDHPQSAYREYLAKFNQEHQQDDKSVKIKFEESEG